MKKSSDRLTIFQLADLLGVESYEDIHDRNIDYFLERGDYARSEALKEGATEEAAEELALKEQDEASGEFFEAYTSALEDTADTALGYIGLQVIPLKEGTEFQVKPKKDWKAAAEEVRELINGYGPFYFATLKEFLDSGPYTMREAVLQHMHLVQGYGEVYGTYGPKDIFDRSFKAATRNL